VELLQEFIFLISNSKKKWLRVTRKVRNLTKNEETTPEIDFWAKRLLRDDINEEEFQKVPKGKGKHMKRIMGKDYDENKY
jgi:hypothetical protein